MLLAISSKRSTISSISHFTMFKFSNISTGDAKKSAYSFWAWHENGGVQFICFIYCTVGLYLSSLNMKNAHPVKLKTSKGHFCIFFFFFMASSQGLSYLIFNTLTLFRCFNVPFCTMPCWKALMSTEINKTSIQWGGEMSSLFLTKPFRSLSQTHYTHTHTKGWLF